MKIAVLGAGPGGYVAAIRAAQLGASVTVIEDAEVGGTCLNWGCIPTKTLIASTEALGRARDLGRFGIELNGTVAPNMSAIVGRKNKVVATLVKGIRGLFKSHGVSLVPGRGTLLSSREISVAGPDGAASTVSADRIIIATGSRPAVIPAFPFDGADIISSTEALDLTTIPSSLLIVGAGVIGCEFACIFRELGTEVTLVEPLPRPVATEDEEISELLVREFKKKKIRLLTGVKVERANTGPGGVHAVLSDGRELDAAKMLVSVGRTFNSSGIGLEHAGVGIGARGEIPVNDRMETNVPDVYAVGDVTGRMMLAHTASAAGSVAARNAMGQEARLDLGTVPSAIFTSPEIASVGLREHQAAERGINVRTGRFPFRGLGKAHAMDEIAGFVKIIADASTDRILGAHIIGPHASDLIHEAALAIRAGLRVQDVINTIHAHPTLAEGFFEAAEDVHGSAIHVPKS
ncbi:MAG: dihydrolipoyl dehydrogenase [Thermodesulfovibrionales bacterium]